MRRLTIISAATALVITLGACGGDDEEPQATTGATGVTGADGIFASEIETAGDYMDASIPDQGEAVQALAEADSDCEGVDTKLGGDFQVAVAIDAASAPPDTALAEVVSGQCNES